MALARTVSATNTQRAKKAAEKQNAKKVFKPVLDNPFAINWPQIQTNIQNAVLAASSELLSGLRDYHLAREKARRHAKNADRQGKPQRKGQVEPINSKKRKRVAEDEGHGTTKRRHAEDSRIPPTITQGPMESPISEGLVSVTNTRQDSCDMSQIPSPPILLDSLEIGLNAVTRALEHSITTLRSCQRKKQLPREFKAISLILVCLADINPPNLVAHIPHLVSVYNSMLITQGIVATRKGSLPSHVPPRPEGIKLVTLPKNAESLLAGSIGLRRISVVAFYGSAPLGVHLTTLLSETPVLAVPWQVPQAISTKVATILERTHIKHIATTAPLDMNLARKERRHTRKDAKARHKITKTEEGKKRSAKEIGAGPVLRKPRTIQRQRMTLRSATAATAPPVTTTTQATKHAIPSVAKSPQLVLNNSSLKV